MPRNKTLALIMAGGAGSRMEVLTVARAKPSLPFAGSYRLIDFPLSNCVHSGLSDVWVIEQFQPFHLNEHLANGRPWDLDRTYGGLRILQPSTGTQESGWHHGNADAIHRNRRAIREFGPDLILVASADHIYKLDYSNVIEFHRQHEAVVTVVTTEVPLEQAGRFGTVELDGAGKVIRFEYKPEAPRSGVVTTEVFVYDATQLLDLLDELAARGGDQDESSLKDFGHELLPRLVEQGSVWSYPLQGYWRDVGVIEAYWEAHMDLLAPGPVFKLDDPDWPILTYGVQRVPARLLDGARVANSLLSPGCVVAGEVVNCVVGPGVVVEGGATVRDSILLHDVVVRREAQVQHAILDNAAAVEAGASVGAPRMDRSPSEPPPIAVVGRRGRVAAGTRVEAGERIAPRLSEEFVVERH